MKDDDKEEYEPPLKRENFPKAERKFEGRSPEGSFGIGRLNYSKFSRFIPVKGYGFTEPVRCLNVTDSNKRRWYRDDSPFADIYQ